MYTYTLAPCSIFCLVRDALTLVLHTPSTLQITKRHEDAKLLLHIHNKLLPISLTNFTPLYISLIPLMYEPLGPPGCII